MACSLWYWIFELQYRTESNWIEDYFLWIEQHCWQPAPFRFSDVCNNDYRSSYCAHASITHVNVPTLRWKNACSSRPTTGVCDIKEQDDHMHVIDNITSMLKCCRRMQRQTTLSGRDADHFSPWIFSWDIQSAFRKWVEPSGVTRGPPRVTVSRV